MQGHTTTLFDASVDVITKGQSPHGSYVASPTFSQYGFGWLRDGAYVALAMDAVGQHDSAAQFHQWACAVVLREASAIEQIVATFDSGTVPAQAQMLPTRYTLDGQRESAAMEDWPNFQLDGYGTWLFALASHLDQTATDVDKQAVRLAAQYLAAAWNVPCYDYWEEFGDRQHTSTLASIAAGLNAAGRILGDEHLVAVAGDVRTFIEDNCVVDGAFVKGPQDSRVDASLVSLSTPFNLFSPSDPRMRATVARIRTELSSPSGGIRRYVGDDYYGGSPWVLLTAWLGWHLRRDGDERGFERARDWVEAQAGTDGHLPEQVVTEPQLPEYVEHWVERWGTVADPLLWSHAKYLLMLNGDRS